MPVDDESISGEDIETAEKIETGLVASGSDSEDVVHVRREDNPFFPENGEWKFEDLTPDPWGHIQSKGHDGEAIDLAVPTDAREGLQIARERNVVKRGFDVDREHVMAFLDQGG